MGELIDWLGKADDLSISYTAGVQQTPLLPDGVFFGESFPAIVYPETDNIRDVLDVVWEKTVSKGGTLKVIYLKWDPPESLTIFSIVSGLKISRSSYARK